MLMTAILVLVVASVLQLRANKASLDSEKVLVYFIVLLLTFLLEVPFLAGQFVSILSTCSNRHTFLLLALLALLKSASSCFSTFLHCAAHSFAVLRQRVHSVHTSRSHHGA